MIELLSYEFMKRALISGLAIALITGIIGPFLVLRRLSLLGDGLAHLAFGGVALGLLLHVNPLMVALLVVVLGSLFVQRLIRKNIYGDAAIAVILSFGVGLGIVITGIVHGFNVDLFSFLIGSILTISKVDVIMILIVLFLCILFMLIYYKKMFFMTFNEELARLQQKDHSVMNIIFTILVALAVVVSIRAVGILLVSALLVIPALIALQISRSFRSTIVISIIASVVAMVSGISSSYYLDIPPSGMIVMTLFLLFIIISFKPIRTYVKHVLR